MLFCFRADASRSIGSGHIMRCLTLADALFYKGNKCIFLVSSETTNTIPLLKEKPYQIFYNLKSLPPDIDIMIVDHYGLSQKDEKVFRQFTSQIMVIDDLVNRHHDCDILLDSTLRRNKEEYEGLVPSHCNILTSLDYVFLRPQFKYSRTQSINDRLNNVKLDRIMISLGSTNVHNITTIILNAFRHFKTKPFQLDVILGSKAENLEAVKEAIEKIKLDNFHNVNLYLDVKDMASLMIKADLSIGAAGTTSWERCCLGLPTLMLCLADNQKDNINKLHESGAAINLGDHKKFKEDDLHQNLNSLINNKNKLEAMISKSFDICDANGVDRVISHLFPQYNDKQDRRIWLCFADMGDSEMIYNWQNMPSVRRYSRNTEPLVLSNHTEWMENTIEDPNRHLYMIMVDKKPVGVLRLDFLNTKNQINTYEISILISEEEQGNGIAIQAIRSVQEMYDDIKILANIKKENKASLKIFQSCGFNECEPEWYFYQK